MLASYWRAVRPPATDAVIAAAFVVLGQVVTWGQLENPSGFTGPRATNAVLNLLLMLAIAWRRRAPLAAVCWAVGVYFLPLAVVPHDVTFAAAAVPLIFLTASAGYYCSRQRAILAAAVAMAGLLVVTATTPELRSPDAVIWNTVMMLVPWLGARGLREREDRAAALAGALATERASREAALRNAAAAERAHIARELHDIVAHSVSVMVIQIGAARMQLQSAAASAEGPLLDAEEVGRQTLDDLRRLLGVLRAGEAGGEGSTASPQPPQPGLSQLDAIVTPVRAAGLQVEVDVAGQAVPLPAALDLTSYRIVQEALTNTLKHGGARQAKIRLTYMASALQIDVVDDGNAAAAGELAGHGVPGIKERAALFGGTVTAGPARDGGWHVHAELPLPAPSVHDNPAPAIPAS